MTTISETLCLHCSEPIGDEEYVEVPALARFGQMMYVHKRCDDDGREVSNRCDRETATDTD